MDHSFVNGSFTNPFTDYAQYAMGRCNTRLTNGTIGVNVYKHRGMYEVAGLQR